MVIQSEGSKVVGNYEYQTKKVILDWVSVWNFDGVVNSNRASNYQALSHFETVDSGIDINGISLEYG